MSRLGDSLDQAVGGLSSRFSMDEVERRSARNRGRRRVLRVLVAGGLSLVLAIGATLWVRGSQERHRITSAPDGVFPIATGTVLVFDDGLQGVTLVDLDERIVVRRALKGLRGGGPPHRFFRAGDSFIAGWGEVYAAPLDGSASRHLGSAMSAVPSANDDRVWLVQLPSRDGEFDWEGTPRLLEVDLSGRTVTDVMATRAGSPWLGIPGGVAYESENGVLLWDAGTRRVSTRLGSSQGFISDFERDHLAWCEDDCAVMQITDLRDRATVEVSPPRGTEAFAARDARFSPDGRHVAAVARDSGPACPVTRHERLVCDSGTLVLIDTETGTSRTIGFGALGAPVYAAWAPDGRRVFFSGYSYQRSETWIGVYDLGSEDFHSAILPIGGNLSVVAVDGAEARGLMDPPSGGRDDCGPPSSQPSGRTEACRYTF